MASLPPQDPSSPGSVAGASFPTVRRGFEPDAVRGFLRQVSQELGRLQHERDRLERELDETRAAARRQAPEDLDEATVAAKLGEEAARVLATAHEASVQIRVRTEEAAERMLREAEDDAARQRGEAEVDAARRRRETDEECETELEAARSEGREMLAEARAVRERIFNDLSRRRDLARQQIESLNIGRQRIMEVFRGARRDLDFILEELESQAPEEEEEPEEELPSLELPTTGPMPTTPAVEPGLSVGEIDVPPPAPVAESVAEDAEAEGELSSDAEPSSVDDLFAKLRAASAETVAQDVVAKDDAAEVEGATSGDEAPTPAPVPVAIAQREVALKSVRTALSRALKRVLADEQNEVLDRLRPRNASTAVADVLGPAEAYGGTYREAAEDPLWAAAEAGAHAMSDLEGEELHAALEARSVLDRCLDTVASELVVPLRSRLVESLEASGEDPSEAASHLRSTYREWKGRLDVVSDDLARTAYGRAAFAVLAPGTRVCWMIDPSGAPCPDAEDNALAGPIAAGEPFPTGHRYAPAYRGCRCLLVPDPG
jgi:cell division septum initiation protein DivIVA